MAAGDEPTITCWTFEDFKFYYEARLGIRREPKGDDAPLGSGSAACRPATVHANSGADLAVFEQFERMERKVEMRNGAMEAGPPLDSLLTWSAVQLVCLHFFI